MLMREDELRPPKPQWPPRRPPRPPQQPANRANSICKAASSSARPSSLLILPAPNVLGLAWEEEIMGGRRFPHGNSTPLQHLCIVSDRGRDQVLLPSLCMGLALLLWHISGSHLKFIFSACARAAVASGFFVRALGAGQLINHTRWCAAR